MIVPKSHKVELRAPTRLASFVAGSLDACLCWDAGIVGNVNLGPRIIPTPYNPSGRNWYNMKISYYWKSNRERLKIEIVDF